MPDLTTSANVDTLMQAADFATFRTSLGLTALATTTPGAGVATFLATPSSANLLAAVTDETGTGALVFGSSPTIDAPTLTGTTTAATVNATTGNVTTFRVLDAVDQSHGMQFVIASDLTDNRTLTFTTGDANRVLTIQGDITLPAGTALVSGGALGTPSSGTATNLTGLPASGIAAGVLGGNITLGESTGQIILDPILSADGTWSGIMQAGTAGAALAFGDLCYLAAADSRWELADADAAATAGDVVLGMCVLAAAADGDPTNMLLFGKIRADAAFPALTIGAPAYVGTTAGDIQVAQPSATDQVIRVVGHAQTADVLIFNPSGFFITHT